MCGICGVAALDGQLDPALRSAIQPMARALAHRGPDGDGFFADGRVALGHRRLAIIDRAGGAQPMRNEEGTCWIVFNGEVYNHRRLRPQLEARGHRFRTASDTEAVLHAYEEYGPDCVARLEGMFAFAIYDARRGELFIARDRLGKKPLFYGVFDGALHFASEMKALQQSPAWRGELDPAGIEQFITLGYILAPFTIYSGVQKLEPGHWLRLRDGRLQIQQYWDIPAFDDDRREMTLVERSVGTYLRDAVTERLESEVPLGAFLSGGIDSGLVVSYMAEAMDRPVLTSTVGFGHSGHNELSAAAITAGHWKTEHHEEVVEPSLENVLDRIVAAFDEPFADPSAVPTYYVSQMARRHVTVALSGDGGDEVFGGYWFRYLPHALESYARHVIPGSAGRAVVRLLGRHWPTGPRVPRALRLRTIFANLSTDAETAYFTDLCVVHPADVQRLLGLAPTEDVRTSATYEQVTAPYRRCASIDPIRRAQYADLKVYLPNDVLVKVDRMSMAHSLEVRSPLLDRRLVEMAFRVPRERAMPRLKSKYLLRRVAARRLPPALLTLPKRGFSAPAAEWIRHAYAAQVREDVATSHSPIAGVVDTGLVKRLFEAHRAGAADHSHVLWTLWMLARWMRLQSDTVRPVAAEAAQVQS